MRHEPDWEQVIAWVILITYIAILGLMVFLKVWVVINYGDMPITEVPSWAVSWLT